MKVRFTEHAVDRFVERRMPGASRQQASKEMERLASEAALLKERTSKGDEQLLADGVLFVIKRDRDDGLCDCSTILFDQRAEESNPLAEEIAYFGVLPAEALGAPILRRRRSRRASRW
jgi:hypothetical protein